MSPGEKSPVFHGCDSHHSHQIIKLKNCSSNTGLVTCENASAQTRSKELAGCTRFSDKRHIINKRNIKSIHQTKETKGKLEQMHGRNKAPGNSLRRLFWGFRLGDPFKGCSRDLQHVFCYNKTLTKAKFSLSHNLRRGHDTNPNTAGCFRQIPRNFRGRF